MKDLGLSLHQKHYLDKGSQSVLIIFIAKSKEYNCQTSERSFLIRATQTDLGVEIRARKQGRQSCWTENRQSRKMHVAFAMTNPRGPGSV